MGAESTRGQKAAAGNDEIDLGGLWSLIVAKRAWVIAPTLVALAGSVAFVNLVKPRYTAESRVLLEVQDSFTPREKTDPSGGTGIDSEAVGSQVQLISSRDLARRVVKQLQLAGNPEFDPLSKGMGAVSRMLVLAGLKRDPTQMAPEDRVLEAYFEKLTVFSPPKTRVLNIEFQSNDPDMAARGANAIAQVYMDFQQEAKRDVARQAAASLGGAVADLKHRVAEAEAKAEDYRNSTGLFIGSNNTTINSQQLGEVNTELARARTQQADAQAKARLIREMIRQGRIGEIPDVAANDLVRRISEQRVSVKAQIALESRTLLPGHPRIKELNGQLADLENELRLTAEKAARTLENESRIAGGRVENLQASLDRQKKVIGASSTDEVQLRDLERSARLLKEELEATTTKYQEALAAQNSKSTTADARIISRALAPQVPTFPKKLPIIGFATIGALVLSLGGLIAIHLLTVPPASPAAQAAPLAATRRPEEAPSAGADEASEAFAAVNALAIPRMGARATGALTTARAERAARALGPKVLAAWAASAPLLAIAASDGAQDQGFALALARTLANEARVVLLAMGGSIATPLAPGVGLSDLIAGRVGFGAAIHRDPSSRLHVVGAGSDPTHDARGLAMALDALSEAYDIVVVGAPRDLSVEEAATLAARAGFGAVYAQDETPAARLAVALESAGLPHVALVGDVVDESSVA